MRRAGAREEARTGERGASELGAEVGVARAPEDLKEVAPQATAGSRALRSIFHALWVGVIPLGLAVLGVWALTPSAADRTVGGLRVFVAEQQIPVTIVLFIAFMLGFWQIRHSLPLAGSVGLAGRPDVPPSMRARFEEGGQLLDEARRIIRSNRRDVERELTATEREELDEALSRLERAMLTPKFEPKEFDLAAARAERLVGDHLVRWRKGEMREYVESIAIAVGLALVLRTFVVEAFKIPTGSMIPTLMVGDHIFVNKLAYGPLVPWTDARLYTRLPPSRGDVMVFRYPEKKEQDFIKRAIGMPGDTLEFLGGRPIINGFLVPNCHVGSHAFEGKDVDLYVEHLEDKSYLTIQEPRATHRCKRHDDCAVEHHSLCRPSLGVCVQGPYRVEPNEVWVLGDNRNNSHDSRAWRGGQGGGVPFENIKGRAMFVWLSFATGGGFAFDRLGVNVMGRPKVTGAAEAALGSAIDKCIQDRPPVSETTPPPASAH